MNRALGNFDDSRLYTIHAFCKRVLTEFSFECGVRPESELVTKQTHLLNQVIQDFRRIYFCDASPIVSALSMTGKLTQKGILEHFENTEKEEQAFENFNQTDETRKCHEALLELVSVWQQEKGKIEKFIQENAKKATTHKKEFKRLNLLFLQENQSIIHNRETGNEFYPNFQLLHLIRNLFKEKLEAKANHPPPETHFFDLAFSFCKICHSLESYFLWSFESFAEVELAKLKSNLNIRTFDDLQQLVAKSLQEDLGSSLIQKVASQYDAVLVDEFQDTDPIQFDILRKLFSSKSSDAKQRIFYIGDPGQSIYKFRGADLNNYLDIKASLKPENVFSLTTNFRSHPTLVTATNLFLELSSSFKNKKDDQDESYLFLDSRIGFHPSKTSDINLETKKFKRPCGDLSRAPFGIRFVPKFEDNEKREDIEDRILNDICREIIDLLDFEKQTFIGESQIKGSDIAILCRDNKEADRIKEKFTSCQIPSVLLAERSIFMTDEALHFKYVMEALLDPFAVNKIRRVLVLPIFEHDAKELNQINNDHRKWDSWVNRFFEWSELWKTKGLSFVIQKIFSLSLIDRGESKIALPENILSKKGGERRLTNYFHLAEVLYKAEQEISSFPQNLFLWYLEQLENRSSDEESHSRMESDEDAVKILTIHKSKGLEFPITFLPYLWKTRNSDSKKDQQQENIRLLYVALTRASTRLYLYLTEPDKTFINSPISRCISSDPIANLEILKSNPSHFEVKKVLNHPLTHQFTKPTYNYPLQALAFDGVIPSGKISGSFSGKVKGVEREKDLDEGKLLKELLPLEQRRGPHSFPAGTKAGNFFHEIFETIEFDVKDFSSIISTLLNDHGLPQRFANLANEMITSTLNANLNKHDGQTFQLRELSFEDRIEEMEFHLHANDFDFEELGKIIEAVEPGNTFAEYLINKEVSNSCSKEQIFFKGFIDLIFQRRTSIIF